MFRRYLLVGYKTTTCTSDYQWSNLPPECVPATAVSSADPLAAQEVLGLVIVVVIMLLWWT
jgi:hypothetical protein